MFFRGWLNKLNTPEIIRLRRSQYDRGTDCKQDIVEYTGNNCYIPTSSNCFLKCNIFLTGKDCTNEFLTIFRTEQRRSNVMKSAKIQPCCRKNNINIGYYDGFRLCPRNITQSNLALKMHRNHFCFLGKQMMLVSIEQ